MLVRKLKHVLFVLTQDLHGKWVIEDCAMVEHLVSSSLSRDHQGGAAGYIWLQRSRSPFSSIVDWTGCPCAAGAVPTDEFRMYGRQDGQDVDTQIGKATARPRPRSAQRTPLSMTRRPGERDQAGLLTG